MPDSNKAIALPAVLDMTLASPLCTDLFEGLKNGVVVVDASAVDRVSTPCIQVLLSAGRSAERAGAPLRITKASEAFESALADLGLHSEFRSWMG